MLRSKIAACTMFCICTCAYAGDFQIKQYEIGLPLEKYYEKTNCLPNNGGDVHCIDKHPSVTIGGETMKQVFITFDKGSDASYISMEFDPDGYQAIKTAVVGKYKQLRCIRGTVSNAMGAKFSTEECSAIGKNDALFLKKYDGNISEGSIKLISKKALLKENRSSKERERDI